jgi:hypothetical protein
VRDDPTLDLSDPDAPTVRLVRYEATWAADDPDANFRADVAAYTRADPLATIRRLCANLDLPVGAVVRYVLARWATGGSEALLELGPSTVERMRAAVTEAEETGTDAARLTAYEQLRVMVGWLGHGLDDPEGTYPSGGG